MKIVLINTQFDHALWESEAIYINSERYDQEDVDSLAEEIAGGQGKSVVLYQLYSSLDIGLGSFFEKIKGNAHLIPIEAQAAELGLADADPIHIVNANKYAAYGGSENSKALEQYILSSICALSSVPAPEPIELPFNAIFELGSSETYLSLDDYITKAKPAFERHIGILVHRHDWLSGNYGVIGPLKEALEAEGIGTVLLYSLVDNNTPNFNEIAEAFFYLNGELFISALICLTTYSIRASDGLSASEQAVVEFSKLGVPVISPVVSHYLTESDWLELENPLAEDMPHALLMPEASGMIEPTIIGLRGEGRKPMALSGRMKHFARRALSWISLREKSNKDKKIAIMLHNAVCSGVEASIGSAFGLDAMQSAVEAMKKLKSIGYSIDAIPNSGEELLSLVMQKKAFSDFRWTSVEDIVEAEGCLYQMSAEGEYSRYFDSLPGQSRERMLEVWGEPPGEGMVLDGKIIITGVQFGNAVVMVQPKRGCYGAKCTGEVCKILHDPSCPPPHQYLAAYRYLENAFEADALIDVGTFGSLEMLPGKSNALSDNCWPSIVLGSLPSLYLYNAGAISLSLLAKRRNNSVIIDYLPTASMGVSEETALLLRKIDEYSKDLQLKNGQAPIIRAEIESLIEKNPAAVRLVPHWRESFDSSILEIREAINKAETAKKISIEQHVFGRNPSEEEIGRYVREVWNSEGEGDQAPLCGDDYELIKSGLLLCEDELIMLEKALSGEYIAAGESGLPDENGRNILPTGRNMFSMSIEKVPTKAAWQRGIELANQLLEQFTNDEGSIPEQVAMNMISIDITRASGEQLSEYLYLIGIRPVWDKLERVMGLEPIPLDELKRPRIDVTVRITGVLRDTWPTIALMMDDAAVMAASLQEPDSMNYLAKHVRQYSEEFGVSLQDAKRVIRIFGDAPGSYGAGLDLALLASAWKDEGDLVQYFTQASSYAYGNGLNGDRKIREFIDVAKKVAVSTDVTLTSRVNTISCTFVTQVQGGYRLLAKRLSGSAIRQYQSVNEKGAKPFTEPLDANLKRGLEETILNEFWIESMKSQGYSGAAAIMHMVQSLFSAQTLIECFDDSFIDMVAEKTINNEELREWLANTNPYALEELCRRLLELESRGKWHPNEEALQILKESYLAIEGEMEGRLEPIGEIQGGTIEIINHEGNELWEKQLSGIQSELSRIDNAESSQ